MMWSKILRAGVVAAGMGVAALPLQLEAQAPAAGAAPEAGVPANAAPVGAPVPTAAEQAQARAAQIASQIQAVQQQALQDPELQAASREINTLIQAALPRVEPNYPTYAARAQTLQADVAAAQAEGDNEALHALAAEAQQLQANVAAAQAKAREDAAVKAKLDEYRVSLFTKMVEINPAVRGLVEELETLQRGG